MAHKVTDINCLTGETVVRDMNADELAQLEIDKANAEARAEALAEAKAAKEIQRQALLTRLGITSDEAKLLLG